MSTTETSSSTIARTDARRVLDRELRARLERPLAHPADASPSSSRATHRRPLGIGEHVAAARRRCRRRAGSSTDCPGSPTRAAPSSVSTAATRRAPAGREHDDLVARAPDAARDLARVAAVVVVLVGHRPDHPLHGEAAVRRGRGRRRARSSRGARAASARRTRASRSPRVDDVVAAQRRHRDRAHVAQRRAASERPLRARASISRNRSSEKSTRSILFTATTTCGIAEDRGDVGVAARLLDHALARVEQDDRHVGGRGAGDHVARVLDVPGASASWKRRRGGDERAVGDVDRDPLLALGAQAVGEQREIDVAVAAALARSPRCARAGRRGSASCRRAAGRSGWTCRRRPSPR